MTAARLAIAGAIAASLLGSPRAEAGPDEPLPQIPMRLAPGGFRTRMAMRTTRTAPPATTAATATGAAAVTTPPTGTATATPTAAATPAAPTNATAARPRARPVAAPTGEARVRRAAASRDAPTIVRPRASAQLTMGLVVDGAALTKRGPPMGEVTGATVGGATYTDASYAATRPYGQGELVLGTRGLLVPGISAYLASQFHFAPLPAADRQVPILRGWDRVDPFLLRTAWTEADGIFDRGPLQTLRVRGGRQYVYGPAVAHLDGLAVNWKTSRLRLGGYLGSRVAEWYDGERLPTGADGFAPDPRPDGLVAGGEVAVVLRRGESPVAVRARALAYEGSTHSDLTLDWTARRDLVLVVTSRLVGRSFARQHLTARYRWSEETRIVVDADLRHRNDWRWDYELRTDNDPARARRYLDLGPALPRLEVRARAGTVLLDNVDVLLFGGFAYDARRDRDDAAVSFTSTGWLQGGGAFEVRVRRTFALTLSGLARVYPGRDKPVTAVTDEENAIAPLALAPANTGERNLVEGGVQGKVSGGARRFSVSGEIYARRTRYVTPYQDDAIVSPALEDPIEPTETHGGARFLLEAWVSPALRIRTEYELSNRLSIAPEVAGLKTLRMIVEGRF